MTHTTTRPGLVIPADMTGNSWYVYWPRHDGDDNRPTAYVRAARLQSWQGAETMLAAMRHVAAENADTAGTSYICGTRLTLWELVVAAVRHMAAESEAVQG